MPQDILLFSPDTGSLSAIINATHDAFRNAYCTFNGTFSYNGRSMSMKSKRHGNITLKIVDNGSNYCYEFYRGEDNSEYSYQTTSVLSELVDRFGGDYSIVQ